MSVYGPSAIDCGKLPVETTADVLAVLPVDVRKAANAPIRDALVAALTEILREYQRRSRRSAATLDLLRAKGDALAALGDDHELAPQPGESDTAYRARLLGVPTLVTPAAILAAVNTILAPATTKTARYYESELDGWYLEDGTASWQSFVFDETVSITPHYPDRLYADDAAENGGDVIAARAPVGACVFQDDVGRTFVLRIPQLEAVDNDGAYAFDDAATNDGMFLSDGSDPFGTESNGTVASFVFNDQSLSSELYDAIVSTVDILKGQGMRWAAYVDPLL